MRVVFKKSFGMKFADFISSEVYEKNKDHDAVDFVSITKEEAIAMFDYSQPLLIKPYTALRLVSEQEKINAVNKSHFCGFKIRVEGLD